jgi:hypothetical protein
MIVVMIACEASCLRAQGCPARASKHPHGNVMLPAQHPAFVPLPVPQPMAAGCVILPYSRLQHQATSTLLRRWPRM